MAPRENYFFYILNEVKWLFDSYGPSDKLDSFDEMWFEFNNTPLRWYDFNSDETTNIGTCQLECSSIPWWEFK